jgi:predicted  nucleic acid-binding Zn-ribbon protein
MATTLAGLRAKKKKVIVIQRRLEKEAKKVPRGSMAAEVRACRMRHYEGKLTEALSAVRTAESDLTPRAKTARAKELATIKKLKLKQEKTIAKYKKQKEEALAKAKQERMHARASRARLIKTLEEKVAKGEARIAKAKPGTAAARRAQQQTFQAKSELHAARYYDQEDRMKP